MCRISRLVAESLSDQELDLLQKFYRGSADGLMIDLAVTATLSDLRLIEANRIGGVERVTAFGSIVLGDRAASDLKSLGA